MAPKKSVKPRHPNLACQEPGCKFVARSTRGLTMHKNSKHFDIDPPSDAFREVYHYMRHPHLTAKPCDANGNDLSDHAMPLPVPPEPPVDSEDAWFPFDCRSTYDWAHFHFTRAANSAGKINEALDILQAQLEPLGGDAPFHDAQDLYATIDSIREENTEWTTYEVGYTGPKPENPPKWMNETFTLCTRNPRDILLEQLQTEQFNGSFDYTPFRQYNSKGHRTWSNLMSGTWAWKKADEIAGNPRTRAVSKGAMLVATVLGSDKTTVSVATGHQEFHPGYISPGNISNIARRAHGNGVRPWIFLPIPKVPKNERKSPAFQKFCRQLYHICLAKALEPLRSGMETPEVVRCPDGHFRRAIWELGPYIADYPEQVWLSGIVQGWCCRCGATPLELDDRTALPRTRATREYMATIFDPGIMWDTYGYRSDVLPFTHHFPRADIHELLSPDLLHQVIKGTFKDHLVTWVNQWLHKEHGETRGNAIIKDIDRRISAVPPYPGIRRFHDGRDFNQWTGDDSKALMKVYISAITGHVPSQMVQCLSAFMEVCYIARKNVITSSDLLSFDHHLDLFYKHRTVFIEKGVRTDLSLPRQHSLMHYADSIRMFGSPNGLDSSITESKHIKAVKEPWRRSSRNKPLPQMLKTITRLDKMAALHRKFEQRDMLRGTSTWFSKNVAAGTLPDVVSGTDECNEMDCGPSRGPPDCSSVKLAAQPARGWSRNLHDIGDTIGEPLRFSDALFRYLFGKLEPTLPVPCADDLQHHFQYFNSLIYVYYSAVARYYSPSDPCGNGGMYAERIRSHPNWLGHYPRHDTVFVTVDEDKPGIEGMVVGRVKLFFSFKYKEIEYPCALMEWFTRSMDTPDEETGLWVVEPEYDPDGRRTMDVIHLDSIARPVHLLPVFGSDTLPEDFHYSESLDAFRAFYINKFANHASYEFVR
ncbi:hypothetical protein VNI00_005981 [Paramarasmius palmivorus]|uniref:C2H2-type domain-containing protein n=1 Tax=Paramarasmius palmivorus TaxID=297713 RepID=A0AAW0DAF3_9AGAR